MVGFAVTAVELRT